MNRIKLFLTVLCLCFGFIMGGQAIAAEQPTIPSNPAKDIDQQGLPPTLTSPGTVAEERQTQPVATAFQLVTLDPESEPAELVIRNRKVLTLRADVGGVTPEGRVVLMQERFEKAVSSEELSEPVPKNFPPYGTLIVINNVPVSAVAYLDLDPLDDRPHDQIVKETLESFSQILSEIREERSLGAIIRAIGWSLLATALLVLAIWVLHLLCKFLLQLLAKNVDGATGALTRATRFDFKKGTLLLRRLVTLGSTLISVFLGFSWLAYVLKQFPYTRPWGEGVWMYVLETFRGMGLVIVEALPNLFKIALIFLVARLIARLATSLFEAVEAGRLQIPGIFQETARPTRRILVVIIYIFALVGCYPYLPGSGSDAFKGMSVFIGLMISLGGSGVINQAMSGLVLMYTRAHQVGDYVRIGETEGVVTALDMLATKIRTSKREEVTIPNSVVLSTATKNFTRLAGPDGVILHTEVTIGYSAPWRQVQGLLLEAAARTAGLRANPPAFVIQTALSDFYVEYQLNAFLEKPELRMPTLGTLHANIQDTFNEAGVAIVSPHYEADPPEPMPPKSTA